MFRRKPKPQLQPEWLIVGLGNPGPQYRGTRHNVGFEVIDHLSEKHRIKLDRSKHHSRLGIGTIAGVSVVLAKPLTFMNLSGRAVAPLAREHGLPPDRILVIADDLDLDVGRTRLKQKGSAGGHNGHKSIIQGLGSDEYPRLKIGIGSSRGATVDHVLSTFDRDERSIIDDAVERSVRGVEALVSVGVTAAMNLINPASQVDKG